MAVDFHNSCDHHCSLPDAILNGMPQLGRLVDSIFRFDLAANAARYANEKHTPYKGECSSHIRCILG